MTHNEIDETVLNKLIGVGKSEDFGALKDLWPADQTEDYGRLMRLCPQPWFDVADHLSDEDVVALIKALTIAEKVLSGWMSGSVSPVIWLYRRLMERHGTPASLFDWVRTHTDNPYLPDGRLH